MITDTTKIALSDARTLSDPAQLPTGVAPTVADLFAGVTTQGSRKVHGGLHAQGCRWFESATARPIKAPHFNFASCCQGGATESPLANLAAAVVETRSLNGLLETTAEPHTQLEFLRVTRTRSATERLHALDAFVAEQGLADVSPALPDLWDRLHEIRSSLDFEEADHTCRLAQMARRASGLPRAWGANTTFRRYDRSLVARLRARCEHTDPSVSDLTDELVLQLIGFIADFLGAGKPLSGLESEIEKFTVRLLVGEYCWPGAPEEVRREHHQRIETAERLARLWCSALEEELHGTSHDATVRIVVASGLLPGDLMTYRFPVALRPWDWRAVTVSDHEAQWLDRSEAVFLRVGETAVAERALTSRELANPEIRDELYRLYEVSASDRDRRLIYG